jgi:hypothetical protein
MTEVDDVPIGHAAIDGQYWHIGAMTMRLPRACSVPIESGGILEKRRMGDSIGIDSL